MQTQSIYRLGLDLGTSSIGWSIVKFNPLVSIDENQQCSTDYIYEKIIAMGSRIFTDGRNPSKMGGLGESLAAVRRQARQARRQIDRKHGRRMALFYALQKIGLMPTDKFIANELKKQNPYELRALGVNQQLSPFELGRALFHLQQRRGFKSSRKDLQKANEDNFNIDELKEFQQGLDLEKIEKISSSVKKTIAREYLQIKQAGLQTVGELLYKKFQEHNSTLCKKISKKDKDGKDISGVESYENYFDRSMIMHEFEILWKKQAEYSEFKSILTEENKQLIKTTIFFQRPLKENAIGFCSYIKNVKRAAKCLPSSEMYRLWQDVANIKLKNKFTNETIDSLSLEQKYQIIALLKVNQKVSFKQIINALFENKVDQQAWKCNFDKEQQGSKDKLDGAKTYSQLLEILGTQRCEELGIENLDLITSLVFQDKEYLNLENQEKINYKKGNKRLDVNQIEQIFTDYLKQIFNFDTQTLDKLNHMQLIDDYTSLSKQAMKEMLDYMNGIKKANYTNEKGEIIAITNGASQYQAKILCGFKDNLYDKDEAVDILPYYGEIVGQYCIPQKHLFEYLNLNQDILHKNTQDEITIGKITNPSVHIALNELRKIINLLLLKYKNIFNNGKPDNIHIELSRNLCLGQKSVDEILARNSKNQTINEAYKKQLRSINILPTKANLEKIALYTELQKYSSVCIYTGKPLPISLPTFKIEWNEWEIDHILPYSLSFNDSKANKLLVRREANRDKGNLTPWEYAKLHYNSEQFNAFIQRVKTLPDDEYKGEKLFRKGKQWRCLEEGANYLKERKNTTPQERLLNDTRYMTRVARMYLQALYPKFDNQGKQQRNNRVLAIPSGKITSAMRIEWKLDNILWTKEQQQVHSDIKIRITELQDIDKIYSKELSDKELLELEMLQYIVNYPMDREIYTYFTQLIHQQNDNCTSDKEQEKALEEWQKASTKLKNRNDHRHHALDAVMIALADVKYIQQASQAHKNNDEFKYKKHKAKLINKNIPCRLREDLIDRVKKINVSHKPDHATAGRLHEETARFKTISAKGEVVYSYDKKYFQEFGQLKDPINKAIGIKRNAHNLNEEPYKYYKFGSNYCCELYKDDKGIFKSDIITTYEANQKAYKQFMQDKKLFNTTTFKGKTLIMRLIIGDMLKIQVNDEEKLVYIQKIDEANGVCINEHFEANCDGRYRAKIKGEAFIMVGASANILLTKYKAQKVFVSPIGKIIYLKNNY